MPTYISLFNWTEQRVQGFKASVDRAEAAQDALAGAGITFKELHWTVGAYDLVATVEAPDDETLAATLGRAWRRRATCGRRRSARSRPRRCGASSRRRRSVLGRVSAGDPRLADERRSAGLPWAACGCGFTARSRADR